MANIKHRLNLSFKEKSKLHMAAYGMIIGEANKTDFISKAVLAYVRNQSAIEQEGGSPVSQLHIDEDILRSALRPIILDILSARNMVIEIQPTAPKAADIPATVSQETADTKPTAPLNAVSTGNQTPQDTAPTESAKVVQMRELSKAQTDEVMQEALTEALSSIEALMQF